MSSVGVVGLAATRASADRPVTDGLTIGVLAIDRAGRADTGAVDDTVGEDDAIGVLGHPDDDGEEVAPPIGSMPLAAGVGDIGGTVDGVADRAVVGDDDTVVGATDEPRAVIAGCETAADLAAGGLSMGAFPSLVLTAGWVAKAEFLSAVIRSYIRLGLVAGWEDVLAADGEDDAATAEPETFVEPRGRTTPAGCRIPEDETGLPTIVEFHGGIALAEGLAETLDVGFRALTAVCPLLIRRVTLGGDVGVELYWPFPPVRVRYRGIVLPDRAEVACRVGVSASRCSMADLLDDGFALGVSTPPISVS